MSKHETYLKADRLVYSLMNCTWDEPGDQKNRIALAFTFDKSVSEVEREQAMDLHAAAPSLLAALEAVEWEGWDHAQGDTDACCPTCKEWAVFGKHLPDCSLHAALLLARGGNQMKKYCLRCVHFEHGAKPDYANEWTGWGDDCSEMPAMANLKSFPFRDTTCQGFRPHGTCYCHVLDSATCEVCLSPPTKDPR